MSNDLSDNQKRTICRAVFLLLCALPTCVSIYFATHKRTPDQWAQLLQAELGIQTYIGAVETPLPDELVLQDFRLYDNDLNPIFESLEVKVKLGNVNRIEFPNPVNVKCEDVSYFFEEVAARLVKSQADARPWAVEFNNIEILSEQPSDYEYARTFPMNKLFVAWQGGGDGRELQFSTPLLGTTGQRDEDRAWLRLSRNQSTGKFIVNFNTTERGFVPCWLAKHWYPDVEKMLGPSSHFSGFARIDGSPANLNGDLTGKFVDVQLPNTPGRNPADSRKVNAILVNQLKIDDSALSFEKAEFVFDDHRNREFPRSRYAQPERSSISDVFAEVIRSAQLEDFDMHLRR